MTVERVRVASTVRIDEIAATVPVGSMSGRNWEITVQQDGTVTSLYVDDAPADPEAVRTLHALGDVSIPCVPQLNYLQLWQRHAPQLPVAVACLFAERSAQGRYWQMRQFDDADFERLVPLLVHDPAATVRAGVTRLLTDAPGHANWLVRMSKDPSAFVREGVLINSHTPESLVRRALRADPAATVREVAREALRRRDEDRVADAVWDRS